MNQIKIGNLTLGVKPEIVLAVGDYREEQSKTYQAGASILEMRMDQFSQTDISHVKNQLEKYKRHRLPLIGTIRAPNEKGEWRGSEEERKDLFLAILNWVDAIDIEIDSKSIHLQVVGACKKAQKTLIASSHSFDETPSNAHLNDLIAQGKDLGADIIKLACFAQEPSDVIRMLEFIQANREKGLIGISMGPFGSISRVVGPLFGSLLTYTSLKPAWGQLSLADLVKMSRMFYPSLHEPDSSKTD